MKKGRPRWGGGKGIVRGGVFFLRGKIVQAFSYVQREGLRNGKE